MEVSIGRVSSWIYWKKSSTQSISFEGRDGAKGEASVCVVANCPALLCARTDSLTMMVKDGLGSG